MRILSVLFCVLICAIVSADVNYTFTGTIPDGGTNHSMVAAGESFVARFRVDNKKMDTNADPVVGSYQNSVRFGSIEFSGGFAAPFSFSGLQVVVLNDAQNSDSVSVQASGLAFAVGATNFVDLDSLNSDALPQVGTSFDPAPIPYDGPIQLIQMIYADAFGSIQYTANTLHNVDFAATGIGDFDDDGATDCTDVDLLVAAIVQSAAGEEPSIWFDVDSNRVVDEEDLDEWLSVAGEENLGFTRSYLPGDANLDGSVDASDFNVWNSNRFRQDAGWCSGDFNADGAVDVSDFNIWNSNKFRSSDHVRTVPEPGIPIWTILVICAFQRRRRLR